MTPCTVYACDTEPIVLEGLRSLIERTDEFRLVGEVTSPAEALAQIPALHPHLLLLDHRAGWREVHQLVGELKSASPETKPILWGRDLTTGDCYRALQAGVRGVFNRTLPVVSLLECLKQVAAGRVWMESAGDPPWAGTRRKSGTPRLTERAGHRQPGCRWAEEPGDCRETLHHRRNSEGSFDARI